MNKNIIVIFLLFLLTPLVYAEDYYADVEITVDNSGFVSVDGITNHPDLLINNTELYTSKKQSHWLLNITKEDIFSDFVYTVTLPIDSSINYVKTSGSMRIEEEKGKLTVSGFGQNKSFYVIVQYQVGKPTDTIQSVDFSLFLTIISISLFIILTVGYFVYKSPWKKQENKKNIPNTTEIKTEYNFKGLNDRQKKIMDLLIQKNRPLSQSIIQKELDIPKAAVSRNIGSLELKGLIEKEKIGMSNLIRLKKI
ncbi:MAG: winged helix-turn-helix transcriptional regulator [Candidatus Thermoplasmatota archaeon]|nr:winged helix-turn-helix transcriptional regulator [Candidatus Thermoplasmatota archaeon]